MEKKELYTEEKLDELLNWFSGRDLPKALQIDEATFTPNLQDTIDRLSGQARLCFKNPKMQGCIYLLEKIKTKLLELN